MRRRDFVNGAFAAAWLPTASQAQQSRRVGFLSAASEAVSFARNGVVVHLRTLGWRAGENYEFIERHAEGDPARLDALAAEILGARPDVVLVTGSTEAAAMSRASTSIPVVFIQIPDPVSLGLVASLARPGGNVTGVSTSPQQLSGKRLGLIVELVGPRDGQFCWLSNPRNLRTQGEGADLSAAAAQLGIRVQRLDVDAPDMLDAVFEQARGCAGVLIQFDFLLFSLRRRIVELAATNGIPAIYENRFPVVEGGLMSYGPDLAENYRRAASYADLILKGARPADLPVYIANRYELVLNQSTARTLGIGLPSAFLARADEVIE